jgi:tetratricopeptide (TPR) repeat protein
MAVSLGGVANMLESFGSYAESESAYLRAIHLMDGLPREVANDPDCRFELGLLCSELATTQNFLGRGEESKPLFYRGKTLYEQLVSEFPRDPTYREELAYTLAVEGWWRLEDRPDEAEKAFRRSLAIDLQLAQESPAVPAYQGNLGSRYYELGTHMERTGRRAEAAEAFRESARISEQVLSEFPEWRPPDFGWAFVGAHLSLQWLLLGDGRPKEAEAAYHRALEFYARLRPRWMTSPFSRWFLAEFRWNLALLACKYDRPQDAAQFSAEAISLYEQAAAEQPNHLEYQKTLSARKAELAKVSSCGDAAKQADQ